MQIDTTVQPAPAVRSGIATTPRRMAPALRRAIMQFVLFGALLVIWELVSGRIISDFFISHPSDIALSLWSSVLDGSLLFNASITASEALLGFVLGGLVGVLLGVALGRSALLSDLLNPLVLCFNSLPKVALAPLFILWFGIGFNMKVALSGATVFFLVFLNTYTGVRSVSSELVAILQLMGANRRHVLTKVVLPSALTWVFAGLRVSVPYALIGAVVGELFASNRGLGAMLAKAQGQFDTAGVFAALAAITALSLLLNAAVAFAEARMMPWRASADVQNTTV